MTAPTQLQRLIAKAKREEGEDTLAFQLNAEGIGFNKQIRLVTGRDLRWDIVLTEAPIAVECQGGVWKNGAHNRGHGVTRDCEKTQLAAMAGYVSILVTTDQIKSGEAVANIKAALERWKDKPDPVLVPAAEAGECARCAEPICPDDPAAWTTDGRLLCNLCADAEDTL